MAFKAKDFTAGEELLPSEKRLGFWSANHACGSCCGYEKLEITNFRINGQRREGCKYCSCCFGTNVVYYSAWLKDVPSLVMGNKQSKLYDCCTLGNCFCIFCCFPCGLLVPCISLGACPCCPQYEVLVNDSSASGWGITVHRSNLVEIRKILFRAAWSWKTTEGQQDEGLHEAAPKAMDQL